VSWLVRKAVGLASLTLEISQYEGPPSPPSTSTTPCTHIDIVQTATAGLKGTVEKRCLDFEFRDHTDWMFGHVRGQSKWMTLDEITEPYLKEGWEDGESEKTGPGGTSHVYSHVDSVDSDWTATQTWGFQMVDGERRYCRNVIVVKGEERATIRLVYDFTQ
jgi:hypothetical protein